MQKVATQTSQVVHQTPRIDKLPPHSGLAATAGKVDCERGAHSGLDIQLDSSHPTRTYLRLLRLVALLGFAFLVLPFWPAISLGRYHNWRGEGVLTLDDSCPQVDALTPAAHEALLRSLDQEFNTSEFKLKAYESLGGAVRIPTECYDDLGLPSEDPRWEIEIKFHEYLESRFPKVHANLKRTIVNTYALVYEWKGTETVKPLMLTAHMDVVPVNPETYDDWKFPPFSGFYDGEWIWGRGSCDDKPGVIGSLTAIETLLERGFVPSRTILLAFGIDEERGGPTGAASIAQYLLETYGPDSLAMVVDEGGKFADQSGIVFAMPAVGEKGYMDIRIDVVTPGGHSSMPPKHTGIGVLADLITELEAHPHQPQLVRGRTYYQSLGCRARYDPGFPASLKRLLQQSHTSDKKLRELEDRLIDFDPLFYALSGTTQAIDLVRGGVKTNALPETAWAIVNHRIVDHGSLTELTDRFTNIALPVAAKHNMTLEAFGRTVGPQGPSWGTIRLYDAFNTALVPAPVTPTKESGPYELLSGTIRSAFQTHLRTDNLPKSAVVSPSIGTGNTDTRHYWSLTRHIFRYGHRGVADAHNGVHTVNEGWGALVCRGPDYLSAPWESTAIRAEGFLEQIRFFTRLILNADQSDLLE